MIVVAFAILAGIGTVTRWQFARLNRLDWPGGTLAVNLGAAFVLGLVHDSSPDSVTLIGVALLGSYSTFSTVMREVAEVDDRHSAGRYLAATLVGGIAMAYLGVRLS